jgi:hypothetical protein
MQQLLVNMSPCFHSQDRVSGCNFDVHNCALLAQATAHTDMAEFSQMKWGSACSVAYMQLCLLVHSRHNQMRVSTRAFPYAASLHYVTLKVGTKFRRQVAVAQSV